jgi:hypothetical protein
MNRIAVNPVSTLWQEPQGMRLSLTTNTYVTTSNVTGAGTLYWTPVISGGTGVVTGYNGAALARKTVQQKSLSLTLTSGKNYDVFYDYDGDALALSAEWTNDTTRADALADEQGAIVLGSDHTKLWIGTIRASGTNTTEDSETDRLIGNAYNTARRLLSKAAGSSSHSYASATWRSYNDDATQRVGVVVAISTVADFSPTTVFSTVSASGATRISVGLDSTSSPTIQVLMVAGEATPPYLPPWGVLTITAGYHFAQLIESVDAGTGSYDFGGITGAIFN